jgi:hypothetical protein
VLAAQRRR